MIIEDEKLIFIHVPKCAGTSIENTLLRWKEPSIGMNIGTDPIGAMLDEQKEKYHLYTAGDPQHYKYEDYKRILGDKYSEYTYFTVIRDPISRAISEFNYQKKYKKTDDDYRNNNINAIIESGRLWENALHAHADTTTSFLENSGEICGDIYILRYENLAEDWKHLFMNVRKQTVPDLAHLNKAKPNSITADSLSELSYEELYDRWSVDFKLRSMMTLV